MALTTTSIVIKSLICRQAGLAFINSRLSRDKWRWAQQCDGSELIDSAHY